MYAPSNPPPSPRRPSVRPKHSRRPTPASILPPLKQPRWLLRLAGLQRLTTLAAIGTLGVALGTYAFTVYQWQAWNQAARQLEALRQEERGLLQASVALEASLAAAAERSPLVLWEPKQTLFLKAKPPQAVVPASAEPAAPLAMPLPTVPLAY